jgi:hypothetical protein
MATRIEARPAGAMPAIIAEMAAQASIYRDADGSAVPTAVVIASGVKC